MGVVDNLRTSSSFRNVLLIGLVILFIAIAMFVYMKYFKTDPTAYNTNDEFNSGDIGEDADVVMFYTDWCPHCKKAKPAWEKLKAEYDDNVVNGVRLHFKEYNRDHNEALAEKYDVKGVPTIFIQQGEKIVLYDARVSYETLVEFLRSSL
jgi:thiol-disulfide isomerase/thioredoxin